MNRQIRRDSKSTLRLFDLEAGACSVLPLSHAPTHHLQRRGLTRPNGSSWVLRLALVLSLVLIPVLLEARELTEQEVRAAVQTWVHHVTADARPDAVIEKMEPYEIDGRRVAYIAHLEGGGFCLCGENNVVLPVYLYSPRGKFSANNPFYQYVLWEIAERTRMGITRDRTLGPDLQNFEESVVERALFWRELISGMVRKRERSVEGLDAAPDRLELPMTSSWSQGSPYNDQCPVLTPGSDEHAVVGCGATAMVQVMYYWKWPNTGVGSHSINYYFRWRNNWDEEPLSNNPNIPANWGGGGRLEWTPSNGGRLRMNGYWDGSVYWGARTLNNDSAFVTALDALYNRLTSGTTALQSNFGTTTYNWALMKDSHADPPDAGDAEVAKLSHHAGIAVDMDYGLWSSGTPLYFVDDGLANYFRYDPDVLFTYSDRDIDEMAEDLGWLRPVMMAGCTKPNDCHIWVTYGYNKGTDPDRQFLMNKGWGGAGEWYSCDKFFSMFQKTLTRIAPLNVVKFVEERSPGSYPDRGDGSPSEPYNHIEEALSYVADGTTLVFKAGSDNRFSASSLVIDRPMVLKGVRATIRKQ